MPAFLPAVQFPVKMKKLSHENLRVLYDIAYKLGTDPKWLYTLINFESGWKPKIKNPLSSARGLIQFVNKTAKGLGYKDSLDLVNKNPTISSQLKNPVYRYLKQYRPFPTDQSLFMSVFYPKARYWSPKKKFPPLVMRYNPGIKTPSDYVRKVYKRGSLRYVSPFTILLILGSVIYLYSTLTKGGKNDRKTQGGS